MKTKIYDRPTRVFHSLFALLILGAIYIGKNVDSEELLYSYHMLFGIFLVFLIFARIFWGFVGNDYSKFKHFDLNLKNLIYYFKNILKKNSKFFVGHNPASSFVAIVMMFCVLVLVGSGLMVLKEINKKFFGEIHELSGNLLLVLILLHVLGIIVHQIKYKDNLFASMITGFKVIPKSIKPLELKNKLFLEVVFYVYLICISFSLYLNFNPNTKTLNFFNQNLILSEE